MKKYYVISQDGMRTFHTREIINSAKLFEELKEKENRPHWNLSISESGMIDTNPATPLFIYGAMTATLIVSETKELIYSAWEGEHAEKLNNLYLSNFNPKL